MSRVANSHVSTDVRNSSTAVYEETRASLQELLNSPTISKTERAEVTELLHQLTADFGAAGDTALVEGLRTPKRLKRDANNAFRNFDVQAQRVADEILINFGHLLGEDTSTTVLSGGAGGAGGGGPGAAGERLSSGEALSLWRGDPEGFAEYFKGLSAEDRQLATMSLQDEMQSQNQIFSLISNLTQAEHQTGRALVGNIRV